MNRSKLLNCLIIATVMLSCGTVHAHGANVFAWIDGDEVVVRANFGSRRKPAVDCPVRVSGPDDAPLLELMTDARGECRFPIPQARELRIVVDAGPGHRCECRLNLADSVPRALPGAAEFVEPDADEPGILGRATLGLGIIAALTAAGVLISRMRRGGRDEV